MVLLSIFSGSDRFEVDSHKMEYGWIVNKKKGDKIDAVMVCYMKSPRSYTGEDVVEIFCHGGQIVLGKVMELLINKGVRVAERGEFTKRAFLNGKLDLSQAEAINDLVSAKTEVGVSCAIRQLEGRLKILINSIVEVLKAVLVEIEVGIDFPDDEYEKSSSEVEARINKAIIEIGGLLDTAKIGKIFKEGLSVVIVGKPNVGKSSLFNAILKEERAIVTDVPGTTRDTIDEVLNINGLAVRVVDTAGIRKAESLVEVEGVDRAVREVRSSNIMIAVFDGSNEIEPFEYEIAEMNSGGCKICVVNKVDLGIKVNIEEISRRVDAKETIMVSAINRTGVDELINKIYEIALNEIRPGEELAIIINSRHEGCLISARKSLIKARDGIQRGIPLDIVAVNIKETILGLGGVTGEVVSEEIINKIFSSFCVGK